MKVCFIYDPLDNEKTLEVYRKMTPNRSGIWKDMVAVTNPEEADYCVIIDKTTKYKIPKEKAIFVSAHPTNHSGYYYPDPSECLININYKHTSGFLEWWLKYDYDYLINLEPPTKTRGKAICIISNQDVVEYQRERKEIVEQFCSAFPNLIDLYGRIKPYGAMIDCYRGELGTDTPDTYWYGKEILGEYKYSLEFDAHAENYFSERVADALLMWCMPIYHGGTRVEDYLPHNSFRYYTGIEGASAIINSYDWENNLDSIREARLKILNELQIWAKVYGAICSL